MEHLIDVYCHRCNKDVKAEVRLEINDITCIEAGHFLVFVEADARCVECKAEIPTGISVTAGS